MPETREEGELMRQTASSPLDGLALEGHPTGDSIDSESDDDSDLPSPEDAQDDESDGVEFVSEDDVGSDEDGSEYGADQAVPVQV
jgi:hypothetical protein